MRHTTEYTKFGMRMWTGRCSCGEQFGTVAEPLDSRNAVEDLSIAHHREVERNRANAHRGSHDLKTVHSNYMAEANDPTNSESDRALWKSLADEIATRLGLNEPVTEQLPLFDDEGANP